MNAFVWLMKREYWENKGSMVWLPIWAGVGALVVFISAVVVALAFKSHFEAIVPVGLWLKAAALGLPPEELQKGGFILNAILGGFASIFQIILFIVLFFYLIGSLYDDRKDRSVLFWKSLPISDLQTVASKLVTAAFVAPLIAFAVTVVVHIGILIVLSLAALGLGVDPIKLIWVPAAPFDAWSKMLAMIPLTALWGLPTYGWLMLCSGFARSRPFGWALLVPLALSWVLTIFKLVTTFSIPSGWYMKHVALRALCGIFPASWAWTGDSFNLIVLHFDRDVSVSVLDWNAMLAAFRSIDMWVGMVAGVAMLAGAVYYRRYRIESQT
jgi:ABC-2 type transport system permease protein